MGPAVPLHRHCEGGTTVAVPAVPLRRHSGNDGLNCAVGLSGTPATGAAKPTRRAQSCPVPAPEITAFGSELKVATTSTHRLPFGLAMTR